MIPEIRINQIGVGNIGIGGAPQVGQVGIDDVQPIGVSNPQTIRVADSRIWVVNPPNATQLDPPVVVQVGTPVVNIAGCVEMHKENAKGNRNKQLVDNDPKGNVVLCDSGAPSFRALDYQSNRLKWETFYGEPKEYEPERIPPPSDTGTPPGTSPEPPKTDGDTVKDPPCPGPMAPRIGDVAQNMKEKVSGFELQRDPKNPDGEKICVTLYEDIGAVEAFLPAPQLVTTTAVIATVATGSALLAKPLADLLLKVVKPVVKKAITFVKTKVLKKGEPTLSLRERRLKQKELTEAVRAARKLKGK